MKSALSRLARQFTVMLACLGVVLLVAFAQGSINWINHHDADRAAAERMIAYGRDRLDQADRQLRSLPPPPAGGEPTNAAALRERARVDRANARLMVARLEAADPSFGWYLRRAVSADAWLIAGALLAGAVLASILDRRSPA